MKKSFNSIGAQTKAGTLAKRMTAYSLAAGAGILMSSDAAADVTAIEVEFPDSIGNGDYFELDVDGDGFTDFSFEDYLGSYIMLTGFGLDNGFADFILGATGASIIHPVGTVFDQFNFFYNSNPDTVEFETSGYLGLQFEINPGGPDGGLGPAGSNLHYGYLSVDFGQFGSSLTINGGAYESNAGASIAAGANPVPEPAGLGLLAMGSVGLATWRRRKN